MYCFNTYNFRLWSVKGLIVSSGSVDTSARCKTHYIGQLIIVHNSKLVFSQVMDFIP